MKKKVLLDLDGVIANFYVAFASFLNKHYGCTLPLDRDPVHYSMKDWGYGIDYIDTNEASVRWIDQGGMTNVPAYDGMKNFVNIVSNLYDVYIVTARIGDWDTFLSNQLKDKIKRDTLKWLKKHNIQSNKLFFTHDKINFCKKYGISIMIEDKMSTALEASKNGIYTVLMNRGYNGSQVDRFRILRAYRFSDALEYLKKIAN